jgi:hypothetical protein
LREPLRSLRLRLPSKPAASSSISWWRRKTLRPRGGSVLPGKIIAAEAAPTCFVWHRGGPGRVGAAFSRDSLRDSLSIPRWLRATRSGRRFPCGSGLPDPGYEPPSQRGGRLAVASDCHTEASASNLRDESEPNNGEMVIEGEGEPNLGAYHDGEASGIDSR